MRLCGPSCIFHPLIAPNSISQLKRLAPPVQWSVYRVKLLSHLYPPLAHEEALLVQRVQCPTEREKECQILAYKKLLIMQQRVKRLANLEKRGAIKKIGLPIATQEAGVAFWSNT